MRRAYLIAVIAVLALLLSVICVPLAMRAEMSQYVYESVDNVPAAEVAIIPGASVYKGKPSPVLAARADGAIDLYVRGKVSKILMSGDNGTVSHDEVTPVRKYLLAAGVRPQDIFLDHAGFDTYSTMYRAIAVFHATSAVIVTQDFHMSRALFIARSLGLDATGFLAPGSGGSAFDYTREIPASDKALLDVMTRRVPRFLGQPYPLSGSGEATW